MRQVRIVIAIAGIVLLCACHKSDPENHPGYIGTWIHPDFEAGGVECDFILEIPADGNGSYGTFGDQCDGPQSGDCKIKQKKIKIGDKNFEIIEEPHAISSEPIATISMDTITVTTAMKLRWNSFIVPYQREFYQVE